MTLGADGRVSKEGVNTFLMLGIYGCVTVML